MIYEHDLNSELLSTMRRLVIETARTARNVAPDPYDDDGPYRWRAEGAAMALEAMCKVFRGAVKDLEVKSVGSGTQVECVAVHLSESSGKSCKDCDGDRYVVITPPGALR